MLSKRRRKCEDWATRLYVGTSSYTVQPESYTRQIMRVRRKQTGILKSIENSEANCDRVGGTIYETGCLGDCCCHKHRTSAIVKLGRAVVGSRRQDCRKRCPVCGMKDHEAQKRRYKSCHAKERAISRKCVMLK